MTLIWVNLYSFMTGVKAFSNKIIKNNLFKQSLLCAIGISDKLTTCCSIEESVNTSKVNQVLSLVTDLGT